MKDAKTGFEPSNFTSLYELESENFWFVVRNEFIKWSILKYKPNPASVLEIGCGTGFVTSMLRSELPDANILASELHDEALTFARNRVSGVEFITLNALELGFDKEFELVGAFDVLEHIDDDVEVIKNVYTALEKNGIFVLTVPQHKWLWSAADVHAKHARRYDPNELESKLRRVGFSIEYTTSFVFVLLPIMSLSRLLSKKSGVNYSIEKELKSSFLVDRVLRVLLRFDLLLAKLGANLPVGGSRLIVARKS